MDILIALVIGGIIGWLASLLMKTSSQQGLIGNIVVGIVGSALGSRLAPALGIVPSDGLGRWIIAVGGAVLLIYILKFFGWFK
ncbi:MAG: GlsB/YeaQ/YmgE family stress response membrane protein [Planctomycetota bacterium]|nr:GlsB/YeaQ/YmgE family stress response membrane protein [Planctomycetota bacterium]